MPDQLNTSTDIKTTSVLDFFNESFDNYFRKLKLSFVYTDLEQIFKSQILKEFVNIDKKYMAQLISQLAKIWIFKLVAKKDHRNLKLMQLDALLKDLKNELTVSALRRRNYTIPISYIALYLV